MKTYHIITATQKKTLIIQAERNLDNLTLDAYDYFGERIITKKQLTKDRYKILAALQIERPKVYNRCKWAKVI